MGGVFTMWGGIYREYNGIWYKIHQMRIYKLTNCCHSKNQKLIQNFQGVKKIWLGWKIYYKIQQLFMHNFATSLCKTSRTHANFYKLSKGGGGSVWYKIHNVFMIQTIFYKLFYKQKTFIQNVRKNGGGILYQRY